MNLGILNRPEAPNEAPDVHPGFRKSDGVVKPSELPGAVVEGLYVHIPFCFHKCHYCDFYSITRQSAERMERFVELLLSEARGWVDQPPRIRPKTIFFGGGTPSLLPLEQMRRVIRRLRETFDLSGVDEWTIECNPAMVSAEYLSMLRGEGVDRLSFGAQSFDREELQTLERHHDPEDVGRSIELARAAGFERLNVDLIYAIPGQSLGSWQSSLEAAVALNTEHLSCYGLTYESNTPMAVKKRLGAIRAVDEKLELEMLHYTRRRLGEAGYSPYEISNYSRNNEECRHNLLYWNGGSYLGLGPAAASHLAGHRWRNKPHLGEWEAAIEGGTLAASDIEHLSAQQRASELIMLQLRLATGVDLNQVDELSGIDARSTYGAILERLAKLKLIALAADHFCLTESGIGVCDSIALEFL
jgi:oxygen-independent coproporphyrinogen-3 oxidase